MDMFPFLPGKNVTQVPDARACIQNENLVLSCLNMQTGRIAAVFAIIGAGNRNRASRTPAPNDNMDLLFYADLLIILQKN